MHRLSRVAETSEAPDVVPPFRCPPTPNLNDRYLPPVFGAQPAEHTSSALSATNAATAGTITGTIHGSQVSGAVADATNATNVDGNTFTPINATAGSGAPATLLNGFGGLTLDCTGPPGTSGTVTLAIVNSSPASGSFGVGEIDGAGSTAFDQGSVVAATGGNPATTNFTFPVHAGGAQISFLSSTRSAARRTSFLERSRWSKTMAARLSATQTSLLR